MNKHSSTISLGAFVPYWPGTAPSQRYRIEQWQPYLAAEGIAVDLIPFARRPLMRVLHQSGRLVAKAWLALAASVRRSLELLATRRHDVLLIHRALYLVGPPLFEQLARLPRRPIVFDFDDAIFLLDTTTANRALGWLKFPSKTATLCGLSHHVVVGNQFLAGYARQFNPRVTVIPSSVDLNHYQLPRKRIGQSPLVIGWTGSSTSQTHLEMFAPVLEPLFRRGDVELRVHSDRRPDLPFPCSWRPWSADTEVEEIAQFDIGIMPMPDAEWARGKCAMKALLYMALGIPAVCSAVGTNCEVIQHGVNGLLAVNPDDWQTCLQALIDDPALRFRLGRAGRQTVEDHYSMQRCATQFAAVVRETVGRTTCPPSTCLSAAAPCQSI